MLIGVVLTLVVPACSLQSQLQVASQDSSLVGHPAPDWSGTDLDGHPIKLADFRGHPVFLNFWASWCGPCRAEQPGLNNIARDFGPRGLKVVGVDIRDNLEQARIFRDEFKVQYPSIFDQAARLGYAYRVDAPPSSAFIDAHGVVIFTITGALGEADYRRIIQDKLLGASTPSP
jgi:cytochrome c biogenesis protein CcmG, thiol:disulfide interchange protein DsbE